MIEINGKSYSVRTITAGDLAAIAPLIAYFQSGSVDDFGFMLQRWPSVLTLAERLLEDVDLHAMPLHEALCVVRELIVDWMDVNAAYVTDQVSPEVSKLSALIVLIGKSATEVLLPQAPIAP
ncbi:MAG: hypothetical protein ACYC3A_05700 [Halothiobacillus sp.]